MSSPRRCSRTACRAPAVATLTFVYADSTAVVGPLAIAAEPHTWDLCAPHADRLTVPIGWAVVRQQVDEATAEQRSADDLEALANAVREAARPAAPPAPPPAGGADSGRPHLRVLPTPS